MKKAPSFTLLVSGLLGLISMASAQESPVAAQSLNKTPLAFTKNMGQWDEQVMFRTDAGGAIVWICRDRVVYQFLRKVERTGVDGQTSESQNHGSLPFDPLDKFGHEPDSIEQLVITARFVDANPDVQVVGEDMMEYKCNYFIGNDPVEWRTDVPNYEAVTLLGMYAGVDLRFYGGEGGRLTYEYALSALADQNQIRLKYDGTEQAISGDAGRLIAQTKWGEISGLLTPPTGTTESFDFLPDEPQTGTESDPSAARSPQAVQLVYSTYLGGSGAEEGYEIAVDSFGCAYVTGGVRSSDFPTQNPLDESYIGGQDLFVTKFSASGNALLYSTYLGGSSDDYCLGIAVDGSGRAHVAGLTNSPDFPTQNAFDGSLNGSYDVFVSKLAVTGNTILYSTYLGGSANEGAEGGIAVDGFGNAYVTGVTASPDFPTQDAYDASYNGGDCDVFVTKFSTSGNALIYSTYLGGPSGDFCTSIAIDGSGYAYVMGNSFSNDFPTQNSYDSSFNGYCDVFVTKFSTSGNALIYSTYLGGSHDDVGNDIAVDGFGCTYVTGYTLSSDFPTQNPLDGSYNGNYDLFVTKFSASGNALHYSTYLGGLHDDVGIGIAVDGFGCTYVTGYTYSHFPTQNAYDSSFNGYCDVFVTKFSTSGNVLLYSTYLGGSSGDFGFGIAVDGSDCAYVTGYTWSSNFPTQNEFDETHNGGSSDAFVTKLSSTGSGPSTPILFTDDFISQPNPSWNLSEGDCTWQVVNGAYQSTLSGQQFSCVQSVGNNTWRNYVFECDVQGTAGVDKIVRIRESDPQTRYFVNLRSDWQGQDEVLLGKQVNGVETILRNVSYPSQNGVWYHLKITCVDERLIVNIDGNDLIQYDDFTSRIYSGGIGLVCFTGDVGVCDISFDNVLVTDPFPHITFGTEVVGEFIGDQLAITGSVISADSVSYFPSDGNLVVEDPINDIATLVEIQENGSFGYTATTLGAVEGVYMYTFTCSTSTGVVREVYNVALHDSDEKNSTAWNPLLSLKRQYRAQLKSVKRTFSKATDLFSIRRPNPSFRVPEPVLIDGMHSLCNEMAATAILGWHRTFDNGNPLVELSKIHLEKCDLGQFYWTWMDCVNATAGLTWAATSLPWNTVVAKLNQGIELLREEDLINTCTFEGAMTGLELGDFIVGMAGVRSGKILSWTDGINEASSFDQTLGLVRNSFYNCRESNPSDNPYPSLGAVLTMPGFDAVMLALYPKIDRAVVVRGYSPIELTVVDQLGRTVSSSVNEIPGADYVVFDSDLDGDSEQVIIVPLDSAVGSVEIQVSAQIGADPGEIVSVVADYTYYQEPIIIIDSVQVSQVPTSPIVLPTFENLAPFAPQLLTSADTLYSNFPCQLRWNSSIDPNPGHIASYRIVLSRLADFSDSVAVEVGTDTSYAFNGALWQGKSPSDTAQYYWKVYAHDDWNASAASIDTRSFKVLYQCGDADGNTFVTISDAVYLINYIFAGGLAPNPLMAGDSDCNSIVTISDAVYLINYIFAGGAAPCSACP